MPSATPIQLLNIINDMLGTPRPGRSEHVMRFRELKSLVGKKMYRSAVPKLDMFYQSYVKEVPGNNYQLRTAVSNLKACLAQQQHSAVRR